MVPRSAFEIARQGGLTARPAQARGLTLEDLRGRREEILNIAARNGVHSIRVIGSVARGQADPESDVDFLVEFETGRTALDLSRLILDLEEALGRKVDVVEIGQPSPFAERIRRDAVSL